MAAAKEPKPKKKMGRPQMEINWEDFDKLCAIQCSEQEIAAWYKCHIDTIYIHVKRKHGMTFPEYFAQKRVGGKVSLRRKMWQQALAGDRVLLLFLAKNHLNMSDNGPTDGKPLVMVQTGNDTIVYETNWGSANESSAIADDKKDS